MAARQNLISNSISILFSQFKQVTKKTLPHKVSKGKELDYPVKPDNDKHWNRVRYE